MVAPSVRRRRHAPVATSTSQKPTTLGRDGGVGRLAAVAAAAAATATMTRRSKAGMRRGLMVTHWGDGGFGCRQLRRGRKGAGPARCPLCRWTRSTRRRPLLHRCDGGCVGGRGRAAASTQIPDAAGRASTAASATATAKASPRADAQAHPRSAGRRTEWSGTTKHDNLPHIGPVWGVPRPLAASAPRHCGSRPPRGGGVGPQHNSPTVLRGRLSRANRGTPNKARSPPHHVLVSSVSGKGGGRLQPPLSPPPRLLSPHSPSASPHEAEGTKLPRQPSVSRIQTQ